VTRFYERLCSRCWTDVEAVKQLQEGHFWSTLDHRALAPLWDRFGDNGCHFGISFGSQWLCLSIALVHL